MIIILDKNFIINSMIILFIFLTIYDFLTSMYYESHYKKELKAYGKDKTYFSVEAEVIGLTSLASISSIDIVAVSYQKLILTLLLLLAFCYSCRKMYLDWQDIITSAKRCYKNKTKSKNMK